MSGAAILRAMRTGDGQDLYVKSPAECLALFNQWAPEMKPTVFNPLIPLTSGTSFVSSQTPGLDALLVGLDWINFGVEAGASVKNTLICLAANYDTNAGMVACALELAMIAHKPKTDESLRLSMDDYMAVVFQVYGNNYAGIYELMKDEWVEFKPNAPIPPAIKTRSVLKKELGHDVFVHPVTLEPCRDEDGIPLIYDATCFGFSRVSDNGRPKWPHSPMFPEVRK